MNKKLIANKIGLLGLSFPKYLLIVREQNYAVWVEILS